MFRVDKEELIAGLGLKFFGSAGWMQSQDGICPFCGGKKKNGIHFNDSGSDGVFHCFKCGEKTTLKKYLEKINRMDLAKINYEKSVKESKLTPLIDSKETNNDNTYLEKCRLPKRLEYLQDDPYLNSRGFNERHYEEFKPAITNSFLERKLNEKYIFQFLMNGVTVAWLARSQKSKLWHEQNLKDFKEGRSQLILRYENSTDGFSKVLGGYDNITEETDTVIIVEGIFDYISIDQKLGLYEEPFVKCIFTFGNNIGADQIKLLRKKESVKKIILMYDPDKPAMVKSAALTLQKYFSVSIAFLKDRSKDPGDADVFELWEALTELIDPINFYTNLL